MDSSTNTFRNLKLYDFQQEAVDKLKDVNCRLIGDEMGSGKTVEGMALDLINREPGDKTLVVAPLSTLKTTWEKHFKEHTNLKTRVVNPKKRGWLFRDDKVDVYITHWESLRLFIKEPSIQNPSILKINWKHIIADEVHRARNRGTQQTKALKRIPAVYKTGLTGTPIVSKPDNLWSILNWLYPEEYSSYWRFFHTYVKAVREQANGRWFWKAVGTKNEKQLQDNMEPFFIRRLKKEILPFLPEKYYSTIEVELTPVQRKAYDQMKEYMLAWLEEQERFLAAPVVIAQLTRLQQLSVAYTDGKKMTYPSSKIKVLMEIINDNPSESIVVFSRFKQAITLVEGMLKASEIPYVKITGDVPSFLRASAIEKFQKGDVKIFLGTIGAGSEGITLTRANTVIFLDRDWTPAANAQAEDRLHRVGQDSSVHVIDLIGRNTIDTRRNKTLEMKKSWIKAMLND